MVLQVLFGIKQPVNLQHVLSKTLVLSSAFVQQDPHMTVRHTCTIHAQNSNRQHQLEVFLKHDVRLYYFFTVGMICTYAHSISLRNQENISGLMETESDWTDMILDKRTEIRAVLQPQEIPVIEGMQFFLIKACMTGCTFLLPLVIFQWNKASIQSVLELRNDSD